MDQDLSPSPRAGAAIRWEPHGRQITACLVALNVFLVLLVYVYFWRFFSRARNGGSGDEEAATSSASSSPPASPKARDRREVERAITALPVFVHRSSSPGGGGTSAAAECAICIAEFADGEEGRLLPRCGHRFHARCVDAWFHFNTTCPLCRATVLADNNDDAAAEPATMSQPSHHDTDHRSTDADDTDSPLAALNSVAYARNWKSAVCVVRNHLVIAEAMSTLGSSGSTPAAAASAAAVEVTSSHWVPHGPVLTACVVGVNVLMILLIFFLFWRFFSGKEGQSTSASGEDDDEDSQPVASPWASRWRHEDLGARPQLEDVALALPVYIYSSAGADEGGKAPECAVCIVELRDGDSARLLPPCGHRFHADCVGEWLRLHATCPLCRASVVAPAAAAVADEPRNNAKDDAADCSV
ncbi:hypothetical protein BAE44_0016162 [Dichanthelium oligosanthes]|uniref:RING-type E3 ubiquitin transferase n=1 Tax=Dichanthelium oligosanthes TaxID=888268 RepID=A0A1E5VCF9_9POAL|nr:hypothetical protein BAE44_0016162 [Dichanthelium oligosanthes]